MAVYIAPHREADKKSTFRDMKMTLPSDTPGFTMFHEHAGLGRRRLGPAQTQLTCEDLNLLWKELCTGPQRLMDSSSVTSETEALGAPH